MNDDEINYNEPLGEAVLDDGDSDDTVRSKSDYYSRLHLLLNYDFRSGLKALNPTKQPPTVPERFKEGRYLRLKVGVMDAEGRGDQNALGLSLIRQVEEKICTNN